MQIMFTSEQLIEGNIYTRQELQNKFNIQDATIRTGIFKPAAHQSIWLFVTEEKTKDRPQLHDYLHGDTLFWDGQPEGRTDKLVMEHEAKGNQRRECISNIASVLSVSRRYNGTRSELMRYEERSGRAGAAIMSRLTCHGA